MKSKIALVACLLVSVGHGVLAQSYIGGKMNVDRYKHHEKIFILYDFSRAGNQLKAKYFASNAFNQYNQWRSQKKILFATAGAFSATWDRNAKPIGLCVDNGTIVSQQIDSVMDAMVIVYNGGAEEGGIGVVDLDNRPVTVDKDKVYYVRSSGSDRYNFLKWGEKSGVTLFQSQLVYSSIRDNNFSNMNYGDPRERRFLAICKKGDVVHHVIVDAPDPLKLNVSASYAKEVLEFAKFTVMYIINLDTGCKNVLHAFNGDYLQDFNPAEKTCKSGAKIEESTNLLVYYTD